MKLEENESEYVGRMLKVANNAIQKQMEKDAKMENLDLAYWDYEIDIDLYKCDANFTPWKRFSAKKHLDLDIDIQKKKM